MNGKKILLCIPTLNAADELARLLGSIELKDIDVLIIDSDSDDETVEVASFVGANVISIKRADFNHANTRNMVLGYRQYDFYWFMTQDAYASSPNILPIMLECFADPDIVAVYARQLPRDGADPMEVFARRTNYPECSFVKSKADIRTLGIKTFFMSDSCAVYSGEYFRNVGGFTSGLNTNEDMEFAARAVISGKKIAYSANATVFHSHSYTIRRLWSRYNAIGAFFARNKWILSAAQTGEKAESTGARQALLELMFVLKNNPKFIPLSIIYSLTKFIAFKIGYLRHKTV